MKLSQKETGLLKELCAQEKLCVEKYGFYAEQTQDSGLKGLFEKIENDEQRHLNSLQQTLEGKVPVAHAKNAQAHSYQPKASYGASNRSAEKKHDQFLCTDSIATEKYVSSTYDNDLFQFASPEVRSLLNEIQTEEQQHAEMIYQYKEANGMV